jgi:hypothetical protein
MCDGLWDCHGTGYFLNRAKKYSCLLWSSSLLTELQATMSHITVYLTLCFIWHLLYWKHVTWVHLLLVNLNVIKTTNMAIVRSYGMWKMSAHSERILVHCVSVEIFVHKLFYLCMYLFYGGGGVRMWSREVPVTFVYPLVPHRPLRDGFNHVWCWRHLWKSVRKKSKFCQNRTDIWSTLHRDLSTLSKLYCYRHHYIAIDLTRVRAHWLSLMHLGPKTGPLCP